MMCGLVIYKQASTLARTKYQTLFLFRTGFWGKGRNSSVKECIILVQQDQELDPGNTPLCCCKNEIFTSTSPVTLTNNTQLCRRWLQWATTQQQAVVSFEAGWQAKRSKQEVTKLLSPSHQKFSSL